MNMLIQSRKLAGVIDFEFAGFSDPMFEFMSPICWYPQMRMRGLEERFCERHQFAHQYLEQYSQWGGPTVSVEQLLDETALIVRAQRIR